MKTEEYTKRIEASMDKFTHGVDYFVDSVQYYRNESDIEAQLSEVNFFQTPWGMLLSHLMGHLHNDVENELLFSNLFGMQVTTFLDVLLPFMSNFEDERGFEMLIPLAIKGLIMLHWQVHGGARISRKIWRKYSGVRYEQVECICEDFYRRCMEQYTEKYYGTVYDVNVL